MPKKQQLNNTYGDWTVLAETRGGRSVICKCICGKEKRINIGSLRNGASTGCGCTARQKCVSTWSNKYGGESPLCDPSIMAKKKETMVSKYGHAHALQNPDILQKIQKKCIESTGYPSNVVIPEVKENAHKATLEWIDNNKKEIQKRSTKYYYNNDNTLREYCFEKDLPYTTFKKMAHLHGIEFSLEMVQKYENGETFGSSLEELLIKLVPNGVDIKHRGRALPCFPKKADHIRYRPDIYIEHGEKKLALNADGLYWHSFPVIQDKEYHSKMLSVFEKYNIRLFQFREDEIKNKPHIVQSMIENYFGMSKIIHARKTAIRKIPKEEHKKFMEDNHLMGYASAIGYGLYLDEELICMISVKKYQKTGIDIIRFANKCGYLVVGGFSKLLSFVCKECDPDFVISFVDLRYGTGNSLLKSGFVLVSKHTGWKWTDFDNTYNRLYCRANMDERLLSEKEYAAEMRLNRIYDAGQAKFVKKIK